jgi:hypothetical protein
MPYQVRPAMLAYYLIAAVYNSREHKENCHQSKKSKMNQMNKPVKSIF